MKLVIPHDGTHLAEPGNLTISLRPKIFPKQGAVWTLRPGDHHGDRRASCPERSINPPSRSAPEIWKSCQTLASLVFHDNNGADDFSSTDLCMARLQMGPTWLSSVSRPSTALALRRRGEICRNPGTSFLGSTTDGRRRRHHGLRHCCRICAK
jgi:hypothetical protein